MKKILQYNIDSRSLSAFRIIFCIFVIVFSGFPDNRLLGSLPSQFFFKPPLYISSFFSNYPSTSFFTILSVISILSILALLFGYKPKLFGVIFSLSDMINLSFIYALYDSGPNPRRILITLIPLVMALSEWGKYFNPNSNKLKNKDSLNDINSNRLAMSILALCIASIFFTSGFHKILISWLDIKSQTLYYIFTHTNRGLSLSPFIDLVTYFKHPVLWEILDWFTVIFQLSSIVVVFFPRVFKYYCTLLVGFHISVLLIIGMQFTALFIVYLPFIAPNFLSKISEKLFISFYKAKLNRILFLSTIVIFQSGIVWYHYFFTYVPRPGFRFLDIFYDHYDLFTLLYIEHFGAILVILSIVGYQATIDIRPYLSRILINK